MLLGPHEVAGRLDHQRRPWWRVWYGEATGRYWALAAWVETPDAMFGATTPDGLDAAITTFEMFHPRPVHRHIHAVGH